MRCEQLKVKHILTERDSYLFSNPLNRFDQKFNKLNSNHNNNNDYKKYFKSGFYEISV